MKKAIQALFSAVIMLSLTVSCLSFSTYAATNKDKVFDILTNKIGFSTAAACGIMANIERESDFIPTTVERDSNGLLSGGLCQWNGSRFSNLKQYCRNNSYDYLSIEGQLSYLEHELKSGYYKHIYNYLKNVSNSASGAYNAAHYWCYYFEIPANRAHKANMRGNIARNSYWPVYSKRAQEKKLKTPTLSCSASGKTVDLNSKVKLSWSKAGKSAQRYTVIIAKKRSGKYDWNKAKKVSLSASKTSYVIDLKKLGTGNFSAYVTVKNSDQSKKSKTVKFTSKCLEHSFTSKVTKKATSKSAGKRVYTCKKCEKKVSKSISYASANQAALKMGAPKVTSSSANSLSISWNKVKNADGYEIYRYSSKKWIRITTVAANMTKHSFLNFSSGSTYKIKMRAFSDRSGKTVYSPFVSISAATAPTASSVVSVGRPQKGTAFIKWNKVSGASGYIVYISSSKNGKYKKRATLGSTVSSCNIKKLKSGKTYYFKVKAYRKAQANTAYARFGSSKYIIAK